MKSSCVTHPKNEPLLVIRRWQIEMTGDPCAAALLSFFEYWHGIKLEMHGKARESNVVARAHGEDGHQDESLFQFHTAEALTDGIMGLYGRERIRSALTKLIELGLITTHRNPNPKYKFDNTRHFLFNPDAAEEWLEKRSTQQRKPSDAPTGTGSPSPENGRRSPETGRTIPETTAETTYKENVPVQHSTVTAREAAFLRASVVDAVPKRETALERSQRMFDQSLPKLRKPSAS